MKELFKYYLKPKKIWKKYFSIEEIFEIFNAFLNATNLKLEELKSMDIGEISYDEKEPNYPIMFIENIKNIPTPESDCYDNLLGITPKTIKKILKYEKNNIKNLEIIISLFNDLKEYYIFDEDNQIDWDKTYKNLLKIFVKENKNSNICFSDYLKNLILLQNFLELIKKEITNTPSLSFLNLSKIKEKNFSLLANCKIEEFEKHMQEELKRIEEFKKSSVKKVINNLIHSLVNKKTEEESIFLAKQEWKKTHNYIPKANFLLAVYPENVNLKLVKKLEKDFGILKNINSYHDINYIVNLLNLFGINLTNEKYYSYVMSDKNKTKLKILFKNNIIERTKKIEWIKEFFNFESFSIEIFILLSYINDKENLKNIINDIKNNTVFIQDFNEKIFESIQKGKIKEFAKYVNFFGINFIKKIMQYEYYSYDFLITILKSLKDIYEKRNLNKKIPFYNYKHNDYKSFTVNSNKIEGLIAGYETDCCMVINGHGESCLHIGYKKNYSDFFVIKRKSQILSFAWLWEYTTKENKKLLFLDSIEILGRNLNESHTILILYFNFIKKMLEESYDYIIIGTDGNTTPEGIEKFGKLCNSYKSIKNFSFKKAIEKLNIKYTDADHEFIIIKESDLNKIEKKIKG